VFQHELPAKCVLLTQIRQFATAGGSLALKQHPAPVRALEIAQGFGTFGRKTMLSVVNRLASGFPEIRLTGQHPLFERTGCSMLVKAPEWLACGVFNNLHPIAVLLAQGN
jgi:hypothetical protein